MYLRLRAEGHDVRVYSRDLAQDGVMAGMLEHVSDWGAQLDWIRAAGDEGLLLFETAQHGEQQDALRRDGFHVIGGSALGDRLENDRELGQRALAAAGLQTARMHRFESASSALDFVRAHPRRYVYKLNGSEAASFRNYVGKAPDGSDLLAFLRGQEARLAEADIETRSCVLMEYLEGIELGVGAYFDGEVFLEPACLDWEHKALFPGGLGELTGEMGTLVTYRDSERIFSKTLAPLAPLLRDGGYVGYVNLNTIIDERGIWPLELTCRFGYPGFAILQALQITGWGELFSRILGRGQRRFETAPGFAVGVVLTVPPFPYRYGYAELSRGLPITFDASLSERDREHLHFGEVALDAQGQLVASGSTGYLMVATGCGPSVDDAQASAYALASKVYAANLRYRTDIGARQRDGELEKLRTLGLLT